LVKRNTQKRAKKSAKQSSRKSAKDSAKPKRAAKTRADSVASMASLRQAIDKIDADLMRLLNERASLSLKVADVKRGTGGPFLDQARVRQILRKIRNSNSGPFPTPSLEHIWAEILGASLSLQEPQRIGYLGPESSFSHLAALREFGHAMELRPFVSIPDIFRAVEGDHVDHGIVPIENSTEGIVTYTMDMFLESPLRICSELSLRIRLNLLSKGKMGQIKRVYSHMQPIRQCHRWLREHLPEAKLVEVSSTAKGAEMAARSRSSASIGSEVAAERYDLKVIARGIEDDTDNTTRFLVVSKSHPGPSGNDKTSIMFTLRDKPGALVDALRPLSAAGVNMSNIDVRPSHRRAFDYVFFIDLQGHIEEKKVRQAIEELTEHCVLVKVLGSYPKQEAEMS
jgi:chorismate mutase/prephenate dehydratase